MSSSVHVDNKEKNILILDEGPIQGVDNTILTINFTLNRKKFCLSLYYNGENSYLLLVQKLSNYSKRFRNCSNSIMSRKHLKICF